MNFLIWLFQNVLYLGATSSVLILLLLAVKKLFRKALSPTWQYCIWLVLLLRLVLPFQIQSPFSVYSVLYSAAARVSATAAETVDALRSPPPRPDATRGPSAAPADGQNAPVYTDPAAQGVSQADGGGAGGGVSAGYAPGSAIAAVLWLTGVGLLALYSAGINIFFALDIRKRYKQLEDDRVSAVLEASKETLNIRRPIPLLTSERPRAPALYGLIKPKILVSGAHLQMLDDDELRFILLHELNHLRRKDIAVNWLLTALTAVYFFNPLVWYAFRRIHEDCEISCDGQVLKYLSRDEHSRYGGTIIKLLRLASESNFIPVTAGFLKNKSSTKRRLIMISNFKQYKLAGTVLALVLAAAVGLVGLTGCSAKTATEAQSPASAASPSETPDSAPIVPSASPSGETETSGTNPSASPTDSAEPESAQTASAAGNGAPTTPTAAPAPAPAQSAAPTAAHTPTLAAAPTAVHTPAQAAAPTAAPSLVGYYGQWTVAKVLAYGQAGTYSKDEAEKLVGMTVSFSAAKASYLNDAPSDKTVSVSKPVYEESTLSSADFFSNYRTSFSQLGITAKSITAVAVSGADASGCTLLVKDASTLILVAGGTFFELTKNA